MHQHTVSLLDIVRFETSNQRPDQLPELGRRERSRGVLGIDVDRLVLVVRSRTTEGKGQEIGVDILVQKRVNRARRHGHSGIPVPHDGWEPEE